MTLLAFGISIAHPVGIVRVNIQSDFISRNSLVGEMSNQVAPDRCAARDFFSNANTFSLRRPQALKGRKT
jgi:hypothetical protein